MAKAKWNISSLVGRRNYIHGLREAAEKMLREEQERQDKDEDIKFNFGANLISKRPKKVQ